MVMASGSLSEVVLARRLLASGSGRKVRVAAGVSMGELARRLGVDVGAVSRWEAGLRTPRAALAVAYLAAISELGAAIGPGDLEAHLMAADE
jgi:transcriptional regulator with XRE-family HTH domain